ncbi:MAG: 4Fe-4S binding protein [Firmicutes bacterium]|nr:4Fe-4S binding protein [Bacillota bacterium]
MSKKERKPFRYWRTLVPASFFLAVVAVTARLTYPLPADAPALLWLSRTDPLLLLSGLRWSPGGTALWAWLPAVLILVSLLLGRVFCGWLCPVGGMLAILDSLRLGFGRRLLAKRPGIEDRLRGLRYLWLGILLLLILIGTNLPLLLTPYTLLSSGVALVFAGYVPWLLLTVVVLGVLLYPRFWCVYLCPTGITWSLISHNRRWRFSVDQSCSRCGRCSVNCPTHAIRADQGAVGDDCILCGRCWESCPRGSVTWERSERNNRAAVIPARRVLLKAGVVAAGAAAFWSLLQFFPSRLPLRPPGARAEEGFTSLCSRCGRCIKVCPSQGLQPMPLASGLDNFETPQLVPRRGRCELCMLCQEVCPTGALLPTPIEKVRIGTAILERERCLVWNQGISCLLCLEQCPQFAVSFDQMERPWVDEKACVGCGACENGCPVEDSAIRVFRLDA